MVFGLFVLLFQRNSPDAMGSSLQVEINLLAARITRATADFFQVIPQWLWAIIFSALIITIAWMAYRQAYPITDKKENKK